MPALLVMARICIFQPTFKAILRRILVRHTKEMSFPFTVAIQFSKLL
jgi:hypothetical protein